VGELDPRLSKAVTAHALAVASLNIVHSLRTRGLRRTLLFAALGNVIPLLGELLAVNTFKLLRHRVRPQLGGVPLGIVLAWYNVVYGTFAMMESILRASAPHGDRRSWALTPATALAATSLDFLLDPVGLDLGLWEWSVDGRFAAEVEGPNGRRGVPLLNFAGWLGLTTGIALVYQRLSSDGAAGSSRARSAGAGGPEAGRGAALLLLSYYLPAAVWATKGGRCEYLLYSAPITVTLWAALKEHPSNS
jgi:uncharacterized membrane protein